MEDFITIIGIIGFSTLSVLFTGLSAYFSIKRRNKHTNNNSSGTAESDRNPKIDYSKLKQLYKDSIEILSKKNIDSSDNSSAN